MDSRVTFVIHIVAIVLAGAAIAVPASAQSRERIVQTEEIGGALPFEIPSMTMKGVVHPAAGRRLYIVTLALGEEAIEMDVNKFPLVTDGGTHEPIGAGAGENLIVPLDRVPVDQEVGQILPSDAIVSLTRRGSGVTIEAGPRGTIALLYELPATSSVRALKLPDGRELRISR